MAESFFAGQLPASANNDDGTPYTLGLRFTPQVDGLVTHLAMVVAETAPNADVTLLLYRNSDQAVLASVTTSPALSAGDWLVVELANPVEVLVGVPLTAAYFTPNRYVATNGFTWPASSSGGNLISAEPGGFYDGNFTPTYPANAPTGANYFADVIFEPAGVGGPTVSVWNGSIELPAAIAAWDGVTEQPATLEVTT